MKKCNHSDPDCIRCSFEDCEEKKKLYETHNVIQNVIEEDDDDSDSTTYLSLLSYIP